MNLCQNNCLDEFCIVQHNFPAFLPDGSWFNIDIFLNIIRQKLQNILLKPAIKFSFDSSCLKCVYLCLQVVCYRFVVCWKGLDNSCLNVSHSAQTYATGVNKVRQDQIHTREVLCTCRTTFCGEHMHQYVVKQVHMIASIPSTLLLALRNT